MSTARTLHLVAVGMLVSTAAISSRSSAQQGDRYSDLARRIVQTSAAVKPGEAVWITGGRHTLPLMEAIGEEVTRAGGSPVLTLETERLTAAFFKELPEQHLRAADSVSLAVAGHELASANVMIFLPTFQNPDTLFGSFAADTVRYAKLMKTWSVTQQRFDEMRNSARTRFVALNYPPTSSDVARSGMDSASFDRMIWEAVTTDYDQMAAAGRSIKKLLDAGKTVHITTPDGTDLRFSLAGRPAAVIGATLEPGASNAKMSAQRTVTLPGGRVAVAALETSASGKVVVSRSSCFANPLVNARFEFRAGKLTGFQADSGGACITSYLGATPSPADMFGGLSIGLNPALKPVESGAGLGYRPWEASGAVVIFVGNNTDLGGRNVTPAMAPFWLSRATMEVDGRVLVRDGRVMSEVSQAR